MNRSIRDRMLSKLELRMSHHLPARTASVRNQHLFPPFGFAKCGTAVKIYSAAGERALGITDDRNRPEDIIKRTRDHLEAPNAVSCCL